MNDIKILLTRILEHNINEDEIIEKLKDFCAKNCGNCKYRIELSGYQDKYIHCQKSGYFFPKINGEYSYCSHFEKV